MFFRVLLIGLSICVFTFGPNPVCAQEDIFDDETVGFEELDPLSEDIVPLDEEEQPMPSPPLGSMSTVQPKFDVSGRKLSVGIVPETHTEILAQESLNLLDKAEAALAADRELTPLDTIKSVYLLIKHGNESQTLPFMRSLLKTFLDTDVSKRQLFDIADQLGASSLAAILSQNGLAPLNEQAVDRILEGYYSHLNDKDTVESVLLWKDLKTPEELIFAASQLSKIGRIEIAGTLLKRFLAAEATPEQLADINKKLGTADVIRLLNVPEFQPQGQLVAKRIIEGTEEFLKTHSPEPVAEELQKIRNRPGDKEQLARGLSAIWKGNETSLENLFDLLCASQDEEEIAQVESLLKTFGNPSRDIAAILLQSGDSLRVSRCAKFLYSWMPAEEAFVFYPALFDGRLNEQTTTQLRYYVEKLTGRVPTAEQAAQALSKIAIEYAGKDRIMQMDSENQTTLWISDASGKPQYIQLPILEAIRRKTLQYAEQAYKIAPQLDRIKALRYASEFEVILQASGLDQPANSRLSDLKNVAGDLSVADMESILSEAMRLGWTGAGVAAAELLGELGSADSVLYSTNFQPNKAVWPRTLALAAQCNDRRIRFAAVESVMKLNPTRPYPGSSYVSDALVWFASSDGKRTAVVACPKISDAMKLSGSLISLGYSTKIATQSEDALKEAVASPDVELVLIDWRSSKPIVPVFAQRMENDARTYEIPIAVLSADEEILRATPIEKPLPLMSKLERNISGTSLVHSLAVVLPHPQDSESTDFIIQRLRELTGTNPVSVDIRLEQAKKSLRWLAAIVREYPQIYRVENLETVVQGAAYSPFLGEEGLSLSAQIRSNSAQQRLVEIASLENIPRDVREKAALAFAESVEKHGVLIRGNQIKRLLDAVAFQYENESPDTVYDSLVKTIEQHVAP